MTYCTNFCPRHNPDPPEPALDPSEVQQLVDKFNLPVGHAEDYLSSFGLEGAVAELKREGD